MGYKIKMTFDPNGEVAIFNTVEEAIKALEDSFEEEEISFILDNNDIEYTVEFIVSL